MLNRLSASSGLVPGGPRSSTLAAPYLPMRSMLAFSPTPTFVRPLAACSAPLSPTTIGALRLSAFPRAGSAPGPPVSTPLLHTSLASPLAANPLDLDDGCRLAAAEGALGASILSGTSVYAESDAPSQKSLSAKIEAHAVSKLFSGSCPRPGSPSPL